MNLIFLYDSGTNGFAMVGLGNSTSIEEPLVSGDSATLGTTSSTNQYYRIKLPSNFTGEMAKFDWGGTYSTSRANWMCTTAVEYTTSSAHLVLPLHVLPVHTTYSVDDMHGLDSHSAVPVPA